MEGCLEMERIGVNAIEVSGNVHGKAKSLVGQEYDGYKIEKEGFFYRYGAEISNLIRIPVITVGGFERIESIAEILEHTNIEFVAISRPLLAEPNLIKRWKDGDENPVKCIRCSKCRTAEGNYCVVFKR